MIELEEGSAGGTAEPSSQYTTGGITRGVSNE